MKQARQRREADLGKRLASMGTISVCVAEILLGASDYSFIKHSQLRWCGGATVDNRKDDLGPLEVNGERLVRVVSLSQAGDRTGQLRFRTEQLAEQLPLVISVVVVANTGISATIANNSAIATMMLRIANCRHFTPCASTWTAVFFGKFYRLYLFLPLAGGSCNGDSRSYRWRCISRSYTRGWVKIWWNSD